MFIMQVLIVDLWLALCRLSCLPVMLISWITSWLIIVFGHFLNKIFISSEFIYFLKTYFPPLSSRDHAQFLSSKSKLIFFGIGGITGLSTIQWKVANIEFLKIQLLSEMSDWCLFNKLFKKLYSTNTRLKTHLKNFKF